MRYFTHLMYTLVAVSLLLSATVLVAPLSITDSFKIFQKAQADGPGVHFTITDDPGSWFRNDSGPDGTTVQIGATQSLAVTTPGNKVYFTMPETNTVHTITSLIWPSAASDNDADPYDDGFPFDQPEAFQGETEVTLPVAGLYVFVCKLHPFMLGAVIADDTETEGLDLGDTVNLVSIPTLDIPTSSDLAVRLLRAFYVITGPANWQDFSGNGKWVVDFPSVPVRVSDGTTASVINLDALDINTKLPKLFKPDVSGVGEIWIATEYEVTENREKPGTLTVVDAENWKVTRKVSLPNLVPEMNNPHNMWADKDQNLIYATQWFDKYLTTIDRQTGEMVNHELVGEAPAHVMTRIDTDEVHVSINGEYSVVEMSPGGEFVTDTIDVTTTPLDPGSNPAQPHAHWMGFDPETETSTMVTPNSNTGDSTLYEFGTGIVAKPETGFLPIATGMMPDSSKYYVSNFLSNTISVINMNTGTKIKDINLLEDYHPISGVIADGAFPFDDEDNDNDGVVAVGALPIQTPVAPNGKYLVTANTLTATITIIDTEEDVLEKMLPCDSGCHGVQFGAKQGGGYYAYVTSKFANTLLVVDVDPNNDGEADDAKIVGRLLIDLDSKAKTKIDDKIKAYEGMGGQGVLAVPNVYNGWVQNLPDEWTERLSCDQRTPIDLAAIAECEAAI